METKEQIERLKKEIIKIEQAKDEIFRRKIKVEDRINHFETIQERTGMSLENDKDKKFPTPLSTSRIELEELNENWFKLIDLKTKIEQQLKELEGGNKGKSI